MKLTDLKFEYPEDLVALNPEYPPRVMKVVGGKPQELLWSDFLSEFQPGDVLVVNDTQVLKRRVFSDQLEILFLKEVSPRRWQVLFPSKKYAVGSVIALPGGVTMTLLEKGRPQTVELNQDVTEEYFNQNGELPLPPYIQKARHQRHTVDSDENWYQTAWAAKPGSFAAPTASLHFREKDLASLQGKGVRLLKVTLHVGLGTFLPVLTEDLNDHPMHSEQVFIDSATWKEVLLARKEGRRIWSLGTTSTRVLESAARGMIPQDKQGNFFGETNLLIQPGFQFQIVDRLLTNFHQPESTLVALVAGFAGLSTVMSVYNWAFENRFRLFSYGDLTYWVK